MNVYLLVEGKRTEAKIYPRWLGYCVPTLTRVASFDLVSRNNYYLFSAEGYPSILGTHLPNAIRDIVSVGRYDYLVVCLDADESSPDERRKEVIEFVGENGLQLGPTTLRVIVQSRCIETWFLGNRKIIPRHPKDERLKSYIEFYNVRERDPELMGVHPEFELHAPFHVTYLRMVLAEHGLVYSKTRPGHVADRLYFDQLVERTRASSEDLATFQSFLQLCQSLDVQIRSPIPLT